MIRKPLKLNHGAFFMPESEISHALYPYCRFFVVILLLSFIKQQKQQQKV